MKDKLIYSCFLSFDVEEWFQVENLKNAISRDDWENKSSTVAENTRKILQILKDHDITATFFILGWVAERNPDLVREIHARGHEIASHGYGHELANNLDDEMRLKDIIDSREILESLIQDNIYGYRAPNFSINDNVLAQLANLGFLYDSSYNPFKFNRRYGSLDNLGKKLAPACYETAVGIYEIPLSSYNFRNIAFPIAGGGFFRLIPYFIFQRLVKARLTQEATYNFYLHPWEFEPEQVRIKNIRWDYRFRHYYGLRHTAQKLEKLILFLKDMRCEFLTIKEYVNRIKVKRETEKSME